MVALNLYLGYLVARTKSIFDFSAPLHRFLWMPLNYSAAFAKLCKASAPSRALPRYLRLLPFFSPFLISIYCFCCIYLCMCVCEYAGVKGRVSAHTLSNCPQGAMCSRGQSAIPNCDSLPTLVPNCN